MPVSLKRLFDELEISNVIDLRDLRKSSVYVLITAAGLHLVRWNSTDKKTVHVSVLFGPAGPEKDKVFNQAEMLELREVMSEQKLSLDDKFLTTCGLIYGALLQIETINKVAQMPLAPTSAPAVNAPAPTVPNSTRQRNALFGVLYGKTGVVVSYEELWRSAHWGGIGEFNHRQVRDLAKDLAKDLARAGMGTLTIIAGYGVRFDLPQVVAEEKIA